jgi:DNA-binding SARP family transcriptional activator/TolB-like protein
MRATTVIGENVLPRSRKARAIFGILCVNGGKPVARAKIADLLWDRVPSSQARASFRQALYELSTALGSYGAELIAGDPQTVRIQTRLCWIDALAAIRHEPAPGLMLSDLIELCAGDLLEDLDGTSESFDQWLFMERRRFSGDVKSRLEKELNEIDGSQIEPSQRAAMARRLLAFDPTHERATRVLMRALVDLGDGAQALREYERCKEALKATLEVTPSAETQQLCARIRMANSGAQKYAQTGPVSDPLIQPSPGRPARPARVRIGVLPFHALNARRDRELSISLGLEIASALARFRWFDVIALSVQRPLGMESIDSKRKELDYLVDGAVRQVGERLQISVRLIEHQEMRVVWSDRLELQFGDLHLLDERVISRIVGRIDPVILFIEGQPKRRARHDATGLLLRAIPLMYSMQREKYEEAGRLLGASIEADPDNAKASAWAAHWQVFYVGQGWATDESRALVLAQQHALHAIRLDPDNAEALGIYAHVCAFLDRDFDTALHYFDRSLRLNPSLGFVWALSAITHCYVGKPEIALAQMERYRELAPFDPYLSFFDGVTAVAYLLRRDYRRAAALARRMVKAHPGFVNAYKTLIAALGHLGRVSDAKGYLEKLRSLEPSFSIERFTSSYPLQRPADKQTFIKGLRLAGA